MAWGASRACPFPSLSPPALAKARDLVPVPKKPNPGALKGSCEEMTSAGSRKRFPLNKGEL